MKAMIFSDLVIMRRPLTQLLVMGLVIGVLMSGFLESLATMGACLGAMVPILYLFSVFAYDEANQWESFRLAMPMSRRDVVVGRYAGLLIAAAISVVFGGVAANLVAAVATVVGMEEGPLSALTFATNPQEAIWGGALVGTSTILIVAAVTLPFMMKMGMTKGVRLVPLGMTLLLLGGVALFNEGGPLAAYVPEVVRWVFVDDAATVLLMTGQSVTALVLCGLSMLISLRCYATREF